MLELREITKQFPGVRALDSVSITFDKGEIHALLGENGAGKSTLIKIVGGIYRPDEGHVYLDGKRLLLRSFSDALEQGIGIVNQEIQIIPDYSIAENIMLERLPVYKKNGFLDWNRLTRDAEIFMARVGLDLPSGTKAGGLSAAHKQLIAIAKALSGDAKVMLLDEPTSSITSHEVQLLFGIIRGLKSQGVTVIFVSHKMEEIFDLCDRVTVLRDGKKVGTVKTSETSRDDLVTMMIGRAYCEDHLGFLPVSDEVVLDAKNISSPGKIENASFSLRKGEILGFYGLVGSGRTELARVLIGNDRAGTGEITINGEKATIRSVSDALYRYKIGYITENRKEEGLILEYDVGTNIAITIWERLRNRFTRKIDVKKEKELCTEAITNFSIKTTGLTQVVKNLSGGNQQKVSIAKWLTADCDILIIDEPTVGVDVGAKQQIHELIWKLAKDLHKSIILISSDMPELIVLARRILVFKEKQIVGEIDGLNDSVCHYDSVAEKIGTYL